MMEAIIDKRIKKAVTFHDFLHVFRLGRENVDSHHGTKACAGAGECRRRPPLLSTPRSPLPPLAGWIAEIDDHRDDDWDCYDCGEDNGAVIVLRRGRPAIVLPLDTRGGGTAAGGGVVPERPDGPGVLFCDDVPAAVAVSDS